MIKGVKDLLNEEIVQIEELEEKLKTYVPEGGVTRKTLDLDELKEVLNIHNEMEEHYLNMQNTLVITLDWVNAFRSKITSTIVQVDDKEDFE